MTRRRHPRAALAACALAGLTAGLTAACSASDTPTGGVPLSDTVSVRPPDGTGATAPSPSAGSAAPGKVTAGAATPVPGATDATPAASGSGDAGTPQGRCQPANLSLTLNVQQKADGRFAVLVLTNSGTQPCHLKGFPGVDLLGPKDPTFGARYELPRSSAPSGTVNLPVGGSAHAVVQFLVAQPGTTSWTPTKVLVTPPDTTGQLVAAWPPEVALQRQDAATHPVTFVGPVLPGSI